MKNLTKLTYENDIIKRPIISNGNEYSIKIHPYYSYRYNKGCVITLSKKILFVFNHELKTLYLNNKNGLIEINNLNSNNIETKYEYNLKSMTELIVKLYEDSIQKQKKSNTNLYEDFEKFKDWNGVIGGNNDGFLYFN